MCTLEEALTEGNNELAQAKDHQVLDNISHDAVSDYILEKAPGDKSHTNDAADEKTVIADREDESLIRKINDKNVQAQWYRCSIPIDGNSNTFESYFSYIPHEIFIKSSRIQTNTVRISSESSSRKSG